MTVGNELRETRTGKKLTIAEVSAATKIQPWVIEALESDRLQELMSPVYVKGFLTTYAKFLRLPPEPLLAQFTWKQDEEAAAGSAAAPAALPPITLRIPWPLVRRVGAVALGGALMVGLVVINPLRWLPKISLPTLRLPKLASITPVPSTVKPTAPQPPAPQPKPTPSVATTAPPTRGLELEIVAHRATWVRIRADGKLLAQQRLPRGARERWTAKKRLELVVAHPAQVTLTLNGEPITSSAITHNGRLVITQQGVAPLSDENL
jgi:cytoskeletal protein RodZ